MGIRHGHYVWRNSSETDHSLRPSLPEPESDQELLAELCRLPQMPEDKGRRVRAMPVLPEELQDYLPCRMDREVGRAEGEGRLPCQHIIRSTSNRTVHVLSSRFNVLENL